MERAAGRGSDGDPASNPTSRTDPGAASNVKPDGDPDGGPQAVGGGVPGTLVGAVVVLLIEALALVGAAAVILVKTVTGTPAELGGALVGAVMALLGAALLALGARGLARLQPGARTPVFVLQLLALPVAYSLWFQGSGKPQYGAPIAIAALVCSYLLFAPPTSGALDRAE